MLIAEGAVLLALTVSLVSTIPSIIEAVNQVNDYAYQHLMPNEHQEIFIYNPLAPQSERIVTILTSYIFDQLISNDNIIMSDEELELVKIIDYSFLDEMINENAKA